jgi:Family of unknown function (DUF6159)
MQGGRISRGWALAKRSFEVLRADRSLVVFPVVSGIATLGAAIAIFGPATAIYGSSGRSEVVLVVAGIIAAYLLTFIAVFFNTALAAAAAQSLAGRDTSFTDGFDAARGRLPTIVQWSLVQGTVGLVLGLIENYLGDSIAGRIITGLANFAWSAATFFVVPVIALEGLGPKPAFHRSVTVLKARWGEGVVGSVSITGVVLLVALVPLIVLGGGGIALMASAPGAGAALLAVAVVIFLVAMVVAGTLNAIFRVALYQFATQGQAPGAFDSGQLQAAFAPKRRRGLFGSR